MSTLTLLLKTLRNNAYKAEKYSELRDKLAGINEETRKQKGYATSRVEDSPTAAQRKRLPVHGDNTTSEPLTDLVGVVCFVGKDEQDHTIAYVDVPGFTNDPGHPDIFLASNTSLDLSKYSDFLCYAQDGLKPPPRLNLVKVRYPRNFFDRANTKKQDKAIFYDVLNRGNVAVLPNPNAPQTPTPNNPVGGSGAPAPPPLPGESHVRERNGGKLGTSGGPGDSTANAFTLDPSMRAFFEKNFKHYNAGAGDLNTRITDAKQKFKDSVVNLRDHPEWNECLESAAKSFNIDPNIMKAIGSNETHMTNDRRGIMQFLPYEGKIDSRYAASPQMLERFGSPATVGNMTEPCRQFYLAAAMLNQYLTKTKWPNGAKPNLNDPQQLMWVLCFYGTGTGGGQNGGLYKVIPGKPDTYGNWSNWVSINEKYPYQHQTWVVNVYMSYAMWGQYSRSAGASAAATPSAGGDGNQPVVAAGGANPGGRTGGSNSMPTTKPRMILSSINTDFSRSTTLPSNVGSSYINVREDIASDVRKIKEIFNIHDIPFSCDYIDVRLNNKNISDFARVGLEIHLNSYSALTQDSNYNSDDYYVGPDPINPTNALRVYGQARKKIPLELSKFFSSYKQIDVYDIRETYKYDKPKIINVFKQIVDITEIFEYFGFIRKAPEKEFYSISDNLKSNWFVFYKPYKLSIGYSYKELLSTIYEKNSDLIWYEKERYWDGSKFNG